MRRSARIILRLALIGLALGGSRAAEAQGLDITPPSKQAFDELLRGLAEQNAPKPWCMGACASFYEAALRGRLASGTLEFTLSGVVGGDKPAYVELFETKPAAALDSAQSANGAHVPLFWSGNAYSAALGPGEFVLRGALKVPAGTSLSWRLPGPVGLVTIEVADADVVGFGERRGVSNATYQLTPHQTRSGLDDRAGGSNGQRLRLTTTRRFVLGRDKTFTVEIAASGARAGQVIALPLLVGESVEDIDSNVAHVRSEGQVSRIDWVASGVDATLAYGGKWTGATIDLVAPDGATKEAWTVRCDDPFSCTFAGDAEPLAGEAGHAWAPQAGQKLTVAWRELAALAGVHTVAQKVTLESRPVGRNLQQRLGIEWLSSSGSLAALRLPDGAMVSHFTLDNVTLPVLKDREGSVQVNLPAGRSRLVAAWEIAGLGKSMRPPVPTLSVPVAALWHRFHLPPSRSVLATGGLAGSPRVELWPSLLACLIVALLGMRLATTAQTPLVTSRALTLAATLGFAVVSPLALLPLVLAMSLGRWLSAARQARSRLRIVCELVLLLGLWIGALGAALGTLEHALFTDHPLEVTSFVSGPPISELEPWTYDPLTWTLYLAGNTELPLVPPAPWILTIPTLVVRLVWAAWAVLLAVFLVREGKATLGQLGRYWQAAAWKK